VSSDPRVGAQIGDYRVEKLLGRGGMSVVYLAEHVRLKRKAAIKLLSPELAEDPTFRARFVSEWERLAQLDHPNIIPVFEAGEVEGLLYIAMRYVKTTDLKGLLEEEGRLDPERAARIVSQTASALDAAHDQDLVHRDVKPANILVAIGAGPEGTDHVYLSDFGLTKHTQSRSGLTQTGHFMGTIDYVAPEQIAGKGVDGRTDQYALACVLYQCLTGSVPFPREEETAALFAHLQDAPPRPSELRPELPPAIDDAIARAMAKQKEERFDSCTDFARAARAALNVTAPSVTERPAPQISETVLATAPGVGAAGPAAASALPSAPSIEAPPPAGPPPAREAGQGAQPPPGRDRRRLLGIGLIAAAIVVIGVIVVTRLGDGGGEQDGDTGENGLVTGPDVLLSDDFSDPSTGWEDGTIGGVTQGYVDGRYEIRFETDTPNVFAVAADGARSVDSGSVGVSVDVVILGESNSRRDGFGISCRVGSRAATKRSAYYFIVSTEGGWSIQKLEPGELAPTILSNSLETQIGVPIRDVNHLEAGCTGPPAGPVTLSFSVNGTELPPVTDDSSVLRPGAAGMAAAGPTERSPSGLAVAFDNFVVRDLSDPDEPS
jgi:tRNA A-37 threonylcarbamoyl transferase component Bud32